jgi:hypothetical protein
MGNICVEMYNFKKQLLKPRVRRLGRTFIFLFVKKLQFAISKRVSNYRVH